MPIRTPELEFCAKVKKSDNVKYLPAFFVLGLRNNVYLDQGFDIIAAVKTGNN